MNTQIPLVKNNYESYFEEDIYKGEKYHGQADKWEEKIIGTYMISKINRWVMLSAEQYIDNVIGQCNGCILS